MLPVGESTRCASLSAVAGSATTLRTQFITTTSNDPSGKSSRSAFIRISEQSRPFAAARLNMSADRSIPVTTASAGVSSYRPWTPLTQNL